MKTIDEEIVKGAEGFMDRAVKDGNPFFLWVNMTRMHIWTHVPEKYIKDAVAEGRPEEDVYRAGMLQHDELVGQLLKKLDDLGITDDTIVIYSSDNGYELLFWPDGGYAPFRGEKGTTWEGGVRVPMFVKWPGKISAGRVSNGIQTHEDLYVTLAAAAGEPDLKNKLLEGYKMGDSTYKVHLDGYNNLDHWIGKTDASQRNQYFYYDESNLTGLRVGDYKMKFGLKKNGLWWDQLVYPSVPYLFNLRMDPMERIDPESEEWGYIGRYFMARKMWTMIPAQGFIQQHLQTLIEYPPRQRADSLSIKQAVDKIMQKMSQNPGK